MYPVISGEGVVPVEFSQLIDPSPALLLDEKLIAEERKSWVDEWLEIMSR